MTDTVNYGSVFLYIHNSEISNCIHMPNFTAFRNYVYMKFKTGISEKISISLSLYQLIIYIIYIISSSLLLSSILFFIFLIGGKSHGTR